MMQIVCFCIWLRCEYLHYTCCQNCWRRYLNLLVIYLFGFVFFSCKCVKLSRPLLSSHF